MNLKSWVGSKVFWVQSVGVVGAVKGPLVLLLIGLTLTGDEQGYWFTFISLGALVQMADFGFSNVLTQYVSHKYAGLSLSPSADIPICGAKIEVYKLVLFVASTLKVYMGMLVAICTLLAVFGIFFFEDETYYLPWFSYLLAGLINMCVTILQAMVLGFDEVSTVNKEKFLGVLVNAIATAGCLLAGFGVWALVVGVLLGAGSALVLHIFKFYRVWLSIVYTGYKRFSFSSLKEVAVLQGKFAVSWFCGFFIFQLFVPVLFKSSGAVIAGQVGMALSIFAVLNRLSLSYVTANLPLMGRLAGKSDEFGVLRVYISASKKRSLAYLAGTFLGLTSIYSLRDATVLAKLMSKLPDFNVMILIGICYYFIGAISSMAAYVRSHRQEKFVSISVGNAIGVIFIIYAFKSDIVLMFSFVAALYGLVVLPWALFVYKIWRNRFIDYAK